MTTSGKPVRLARDFKKKIWGRTRLAPLFPDQDEPIGEVWFQADLPLLVKFVMTAEKLSVQVHPDDDFAAAHENSRGKTEMWHVLEAEPGAQIALGFKNRLSADQLRQAALSGEIEHLLRWCDVKPGDTFLVPAHTVHALGAGLVVCEIQEYSDITYRLYDYGRRRELHLEKGLQVADPGPAEVRPRPFPIHCEHFHTERMQIEQEETYPETDRFHIVVCLNGRGMMGDERFAPGDAWLIPAGSRPFRIDAYEPASMLRTWVP